MQDDTAQGDPRLQPIKPGPRVAAGYVDPCIVSVETTLPGEIPMLAQFWAASSREVHAPGTPLHWELTDVVIFKSVLHRKKRATFNDDWRFTMHREPSTKLPSFQPRRTRLCDLSAVFDHVPERIHQWHVRHLEASVESRLRQSLTRHAGEPDRFAPLLLRCTGVNWPSVRDAADAACKRLARPAWARISRRRPSLARRVLSAFKKQLKLATV
jgi:hypothetical protein